MLKSFEMTFTFEDKPTPLRVIGTMDGENVNVSFPDSPDLETEDATNLVSVSHSLTHLFREVFAASVLEGFGRTLEEGKD